MYMKNMSLLISFFVAALIGSSFGKQCYTCSGATNCAADITTMTASDCSGPCKIQYSVTSVSGVNAVSVTSRSCSSSCYESSSSYTFSGLSTTSITNCCDGDKCNGAISASPSTLQTCVKCTGSSSFSSDSCGTVSTTSSTAKCPGKCFTEVSTPSIGSYVSYSRGCSAVCSDSDVNGKRMKCCDGASCNKNATAVVPAGYTTCWSCTGDSSTCPEKGFDPYSLGTPLKICKGRCSKAKGKLLGITTVSRDCEQSCTPGKQNFFGISAEVWCCDGDKCNGAQTVQQGTIVMAVIALSLGIWFG